MPAHFVHVFHSMHPKMVGGPVACGAQNCAGQTLLASDLVDFVAFPGKPFSNVRFPLSNADQTHMEIRQLLWASLTASWSVILR
jgi:hypothetical protein